MTIAIPGHRAGVTAAARLTPAERGVRAALFALLLLLLIGTFYIEPPLPIGGSLIVPAYPLIGLLPMLVFLLLEKFRRSDLQFLVAMFALLMLSSVASPGRAFVGQKLLGSAQILVGLSAMVCTIRLAEQLPAAWVRHLLAACWIGILVGAALEALGPLQDAVAAFGRSVYGGDGNGYTFYDNAARDLELRGFIRPKFLTSEPSLVAIGFLVLVNAWLALEATSRRVVIAVVASLVAYVVIGSPVALGSAICAVIIGSRGSIGRRLLRMAQGAAILGACGVVVALAAPDALRLLVDRVSQALSIDVAVITSENLRLAIPAVVAVDAIRASPALGVGVSGKEVIPSITSLPFQDFASDVQLANSFFTAIVYFGLAGLVLLGGIFARYLRALGIARRLDLLLVVAVFANTMGGLESPRFWGFISLLMVGFRGPAPTGTPEAATS